MRNFKIKTKNIVKAALMTAAALAAQSAAFCVDVNVATSVDNLMRLVFGVSTLIGVVNVFTGAKAWINAAQGGDGGQDEQAGAKGRSKVIKGLFEAAGPWLITTILGLDPLAIGTSLFG